MKDIINNLNKSDPWKIQVKIAINYISFKEIDEERVMHSNSDNIETMIYCKADKLFKNIFESLLRRYEVRLETSMKFRDFIFDCIRLLYY